MMLHIDNLYLLNSSDLQRLIAMLQVFANVSAVTPTPAQPTAQPTTPFA